MLRSILVPVDGSEFAERAIPLATRLAQASRATLHLVLAHDPIEGIGPFAELGPPSVLLMEEMERREEAYLKRLAARLRRQKGLRVKVRQVDGMAGRVIAKVAGAVKADLLVMSTHGRGALRRFGLGSVADYVVRQLDVPILLVPAESAPARGLPGRRILVPLDLSTESADVLPILDQLGHRRGAGVRVQLLHVVVPVYSLAFPTMPFPMTESAAVTELRWAQARQSLARAKLGVARRGFTVSTRVVAGARAAARILDVLHHGNFDLVAMTTHGHRGIRRFLLGSVASKVIRHARKPVLIVRPRLPRRRRGARK